MRNGKTLPESLIREIQKYVQGETIYIPKRSDHRQKWGTHSGSRKLLDQRNASIKHAYLNGTTLDELANEYFLSIETIKKIIYAKV